MMLGGFSVNGIVFDISMKELEVRGWLLPRNEYDSIEMYYHNKLLGSAEVDILRGDVIRNFPQYIGQNPGFEFKMQDFEYVEDDNTILCLVKKDGKYVDSLIGNLEIRYGKTIEFVNKYLETIQRCVDFKATEKNVIMLCKEEQKDVLNKISQVKLVTDVEYVKEEKNGYVFLTYETYEEAEKVLIDLGFEFSTDFLPVWYAVAQELHYSESIFWGGDSVKKRCNLLKSIKKIAVLYGNCQMEKIAKGLACSAQFSEEYVVVVLPGIHEFQTSDFLKLRSILGFADLFIYQNVKMNNRHSVLIGTDYVLTALGTNCKKVCIPNIYFSGYYPQTCKNKYNKRNYFPTGDVNINRLYEEERLCESTLAELQDENYYTKEFVTSVVNESLLELKSREKSCDVGIVDYIEKNYKKKKLFYTNNHPIQCVLEEIIQRILCFLYGQRETSYKWDISIGNLDWIGQPIYNSVRKHLELEFDEEGFIPNIHYNKGDVDWKEYLEMYIDNCFK